MRRLFRGSEAGEDAGYLIDEWGSVFAKRLRRDMLAIEEGRGLRLPDGMDAVAAQRRNDVGVVAPQSFRLERSKFVVIRVPFVDIRVVRFSNTNWHEFEGIDTNDGGHVLG